MPMKLHEDRFIEKCRLSFGTLTLEAELLLRHGFSSGARELGNLGYIAGVREQRERVLKVLGAAARKDRVLL